MNLFAQTAVAHVLNTLPEGLLLAGCAWLLLRLLPRQNSGTRFAIWLLALAGVAGLPILSAARSGASSLLPQTHPEITLSPFWASALLLLWIPISLLALARVATGLWQVRRIRTQCREVPIADLDPLLRELFTDLKRPVGLLICDQARVPAAMGFRHPVVVLPTWTLRDLPPDQLRHILIHELAHIRRHDDWTNLVQKITRAIFFFHPAVWWIDARLSIEREMACDEAVLAQTGNPHAYAGCLIDLLERGCARRGWTMAQAAVARARDASVRIRRILEHSRPSSTRLGRKALGLATGVSLACSAVALCSPGFVSFAPVHTQAADATRAVRTFAHGRIPAPHVVTAMYHPPRATDASPAPQVLSRTQPVEHEPLRQHAPAVRNVMHAKHENRVPAVVMAGLKQTPHSQPLPVTAAFLVIESTTQVAPAAARMPAAGAEPASIENGSVLKVQMIRVVYQDADGIHVQVVRLVTRIPAAIVEGSAQSI